MMMVILNSDADADVLGQLLWTWMLMLVVALMLIMMLMLMMLMFWANYWGLGLSPPHLDTNMLRLFLKPTSFKRYFIIIIISIISIIIQSPPVRAASSTAFHAVTLFAAFPHTPS